MKKIKIGNIRRTGKGFGISIRKTGDITGYFIGEKWPISAAR